MKQRRCTLTACRHTLVRYGYQRAILRWLQQHADFFLLRMMEGAMVPLRSQTTFRWSRSGSNANIADSSADAFPIGFTIRIATFDDLPFLVELETFWEHESLACNGTIRQRLEAHPLGQIVAVSADGKLLGALYSQRVPSYESLTNTTQDHELELHTSHGPVMHLLGVVRDRSQGRW